MIRRALTVLVISVSLFSFMSVLRPVSASAALPPDATSSEKTCNKSGFLGLPTWYRYLKLDSNCDISGPTKGNCQKGQDGCDLDWVKVVSDVALAIVDILLRVGGIISVGFIIYGGFQYMTSQGEPEKTKHAQDTILNALIGLLIIIFSVAIVNFVGSVLWK